MNVDLDAFLEKNLEGYLFEDMETLKAAQPSSGTGDGACGYPLLMTTFAGIELLGNLVSSQPFDSSAGKERFDEFWREYLYPTDSFRRAAGVALYKLGRHGLAHAFVVKGELEVYKDNPGSHLRKTPKGVVSVSAVQLATDLRGAYDVRVKAVATQGNPLRRTMERRLAEMGATYSRQAATVIADLALPAPADSAVRGISVSLGLTAATLPGLSNINKSTP